jgi:hypothetical protein
MAENPYSAPEAVSPAERPFQWIRVTVAASVAYFGVLTGIGAARHFLALFSGPGPDRDVAAFAFPLFAIAAVGCVIGALGVARRRTKLTITGISLFTLGVGGWYLFLYAVTARWFG